MRWGKPGRQAQGASQAGGRWGPSQAGGRRGPSQGGRRWGPRQAGRRWGPRQAGRRWGPSQAGRRRMLLVQRLARADFSAGCRSKLSKLNFFIRR